ARASHSSSPRAAREDRSQPECKPSMGAHVLGPDVLLCGPTTLCAAQLQHHYGPTRCWCSPATLKQAQKHPS
ncbi:Unknown protein, partial [Striga hermonthica]